MVTVDLVILEELRHYLQALEPEAEAGLEELLIADGRCHAPILYWWNGEHNVVVDGMHRLEICRKHGIHYNTEPKIFKDLAEVKRWMLAHALNQRNIKDTVAYRVMLADELKKEVAAKTAGDSASKVAKSKGVSRGTVTRAAKLAKAMEQIPFDLRAKLESDEIKASQADITKLSKMSDAAKAAVARDIRVGNASTLKDAMAGKSSPKKAKKGAVPTKEDVAKEVAAAEASPPSAEEQCAEYNKRIEKWCRTVKKLAVETMPDDEWLTLKGLDDAILSKLDSAFAAARSAKAVVCPVCGGDGCDKCKEFGFMPKHIAKLHGG